MSRPTLLCADDCNAAAETRQFYFVYPPGASPDGPTNIVGPSDVYWGMNGLPMASALPVAVPGNPADRLSVLFDTHHERLYRLARRLVVNAEDARDLVQETFLKAAQRVPSVPVGATAEEAWLVRVLINIRRDQWRRAAVRKRYDMDAVHSRRLHKDEEGALIAREAVWRALDLLSPRRRAVVVMHELEGLAISAIAALLGISAITVRWHLSVGRRDLARALRPLMERPHDDR